jgi:Zn-dependent M28 family amino/carboxypeptidase
MLETAEQMTALGIRPVNEVRFIFFSGEEQGLLGSDHYVSQLSNKQLQDISAMLDFDMLASPNYARFIYDGDGDEHGFAGPNGSGTIERVSKEFWDSQRLAYETIPFDGRSDYDAFTTAGIPAGGIFAGAEDIKQPYQVALYGGTAGEAFDRCYHQLCDDLTNINDQGARRALGRGRARGADVRDDAVVGGGHGERLAPGDQAVRLEGAAPAPVGDPGGRGTAPVRAPLPAGPPAARRR